MEERQYTSYHVYEVGEVYKEIWRYVRGKSVNKGVVSKIEKRLLDLALPRIIMEFGGWATLLEAFVIVEQYNCTLYQHDATDLISLLVDSSKSRKILVATA